MAKGFIKANINGDDCLVHIEGELDDIEIIGATIGIVLSVAEHLSMDVVKLTERICKACDAIKNKGERIIEVCESNFMEAEGEEG